MFLTKLSILIFYTLIEVKKKKKYTFGQMEAGHCYSFWTPVSIFIFCFALEFWFINQALFGS